MIIFINLTDQILEGEKAFAFFCTVTDKFISFADEQVFDSKEDFIQGYNLNKGKSLSVDGTAVKLSRYTSLIPFNF